VRMIRCVAIVAAIWAPATTALARAQFQSGFNPQGRIVQMAPADSTSAERIRAARAAAARKAFPLGEVAAVLNSFWGLESGKGLDYSQANDRRTSTGYLVTTLINAGPPAIPALTGAVEALIRMGRDSPAAW
jgi:hypothetical protein